MIRFINEGEELKLGLNIYHPDLRATSIGFKLKLSEKLIWTLRWNPRQSRFYNYAIRL